MKKPTRKKQAIKRAPKNTIDRQIARTGNHAVQRRLARTGRADLPTGLELFVVNWERLRRLRASPERAASTVLAEELEREGRNLMIAAMAHERPDILVEIARLMRQRAQQKPHQPDQLRLALLEGMQAGEPLNATVRHLQTHKARVGTVAKRHLQRLRSIWRKGE